MYFVYFAKWLPLFLYLTCTEMITRSDWESTSTNRKSVPGPPVRSKISFVQLVVRG